jgi:urea transporter
LETFLYARRLDGVLLVASTDRTSFRAAVFSLLAALTNFFARAVSFFRADFFGSLERAFFAASAMSFATSLAVRTAIPTVEPIERATLSIVVAGALGFLMLPPVRSVLCRVRVYHLAAVSTPSEKSGPCEKVAVGQLRTILWT